MNAAPVIALDHPAALDAARVGDDAAALAAARAAGLPVGPGVVLTSGWDVDDAATVELLWQIISHDGAIALSVRPSHVGASTHAAASVVRSADDLLDAARAVRADSADRVAVLVQTVVVDDWRGVLVADGGSGWRRRLLVHASSSAGDVTAELDGRGRLRRLLAGRQLDHPPVEVLARLSRLHERIGAVLGGSPDVEFAIAGGHLRAVHIRTGVDAVATVTEDMFETAA